MCSLATVGLALLVNAFAPEPDATNSVIVRGQVVNDQGAPVADVTVVAVKKTWPNDQYQQRMLKTTTDNRGNFQFNEFAPIGKQYAFLVTIISDQWLMTSEYRLVKDGSQHEPVILRTEKSKPVTIRFLDESGKPIPGIRALPGNRVTKDGKEYFSYAQQVLNSGIAAGKDGEVQFGSWKPQERGSIIYHLNNEILSADFSVPENRSVSVTVQTSALKPPGAPIHVEGRVADAAGKPVANIQVLAIQKTWPQKRYRQNALSTTTDAQGRFRFEKFASANAQYAFLLTLAPDGYAMTSKYELVKDGSQRDLITLKLEPTDPVVLVLKDASGKPLMGIDVSPAQRTVNESTAYLNYSMHAKNTAKKTDANGEVSFSAWKVGESGSVFYLRNEKLDEVQFEVDKNRRVTITLP